MDFLSILRRIEVLRKRYNLTQDGVNFTTNDIAINMLPQLPMAKTKKMTSSHEILFRIIKWKLRPEKFRVIVFSFLETTFLVLVARYDVKSIQFRIGGSPNKCHLHEGRHLSNSHPLLSLRPYACLFSRKLPNDF